MKIFFCNGYMYTERKRIPLIEMNFIIFFCSFLITVNVYSKNKLEISLNTSNLVNKDFLPILYMKVMQVFLC